MWGVLSPLGGRRPEGRGSGVEGERVVQSSEGLGGAPEQLGSSREQRWRPVEVGTAEASASASAARPGPGARETGLLSEQAAGDWVLRGRGLGTRSRHVHTRRPVTGDSGRGRCSHRCR